MAKHSRTNSKVSARAVKPAKTKPEAPRRAEDLFSRN
jgi:hypothetical protein